MSFQEGLGMLMGHPMFGGLLRHSTYRREKGNLCPENGWAVVAANGMIHVHPSRRADPREWMYVLAHCLLHLGFGHIREREHPREWNAACDCYVARFLWDLRLGLPPDASHSAIELPARTEDRLYEIFCEQGISPHLQALGTGSPGGIDMVVTDLQYYGGKSVDWQSCFGQGLVLAVTSAVNVAAGVQKELGSYKRTTSTARRAREWFINSYPLLGALAASFEVIEDPLLCQRMSISVAAVNAEAREIYLNPAAGLDEEEVRFVMAHELLHVGLRHAARRQGRDPFLWNVACDFVINGWLVEMGLGEMPSIGGLLDPEFKGESAESIYDRIVTDMRRFRKLCTLRGFGIGDMLEPNPDWWFRGAGVELDEFYRRCLCQGMEYHDSGRGFLPAGLIEEIRAMSQPPIAWDVELARWFDHYFPPVEKVRSYARPSRRQSSTPEIPRPRYVPDRRFAEGRTFGVVLDTSGSMDRELLAKALGAIASYSASRDVPAARVVFCDADAYDQGYMPPEEVAGRVRVKGRGGTILQPGIDLLERAKDFPKEGPVLIITDGYCDHFHVHRDHAILLPEGHHLPFPPRGKVFRIR